MDMFAWLDLDWLDSICNSKAVSGYVVVEEVLVKELVEVSDLHLVLVEEVLAELYASPSDHVPNEEEGEPHSFKS